MTTLIFVSVALGIGAGFFLIPESIIINYSEISLIIGLCILLFFVGLELGKSGTVTANFKKIGFVVFLFPISSIIGSLAFAGIFSYLVGIKPYESMAVVSGFGWYTLAPIMLADYSSKISAMAFIHNVMRETIGIILIPIIAKRFGYIECCSLPGASAMDVSLPIVEKSTSQDIVVYSFVMGLFYSIAVPFLVPFFISLKLFS